MKRLTTTLTLAAALALAVVATAPPARADVTNPADNPVKITVTGDDGSTYVDGQDTLPGYDDYACTYIPGAWFDFAHNRVHYADGQSIPWTEWDRATGYQAWLAKQAAPAPAPAPSTTTASTGASSTGASSTGASSTGASSTTGQKSGTRVAGVAAPAPGAAPTAAPTPSGTPSASPTARADGPSPAPSASTQDVVLAASGAGRGSGGSSSTAGLAILGVLFGLGGLAFGGYTFSRARHSSKESLS